MLFLTPGVFRRGGGEGQEKVEREKKVLTFHELSALEKGIFFYLKANEDQGSVSRANAVLIRARTHLETAGEQRQTFSTFCCSSLNIIAAFYLLLIQSKQL